MRLTQPILKIANECSSTRVALHFRLLAKKERIKVSIWHIDAVPLGRKMEPQNLHGFATGGGAVLRTQIMEEALDDVLTRYEKAFRVALLYPEEFTLAEASEFYPAPLDRSDAADKLAGCSDEPSPGAKSNRDNTPAKAVTRDELEKTARASTL
jgi:hypothetical protein